MLKHNKTIRKPVRDLLFVNLHINGVRSTNRRENVAQVLNGLVFITATD